MGYIEEINELLVPRHTEEAVVLDLFAGCGGLALGFEAAGYKTIGFEMNEPASASYRHNLGSECYAVKLEVGFDFPQADIVIGGPPCQPFSVGGNQRGIEDARDGFLVQVASWDMPQHILTIPLHHAIPSQSIMCQLARYDGWMYAIELRAGLDPLRVYLS